ncbi:MAG TPA: CvpA family protein [Dehalococcoidia bacterium]|nr:CvpA family protein [Dehalococcoidia bacterium]
MTWVDIIALGIIALSFFGGLREGAVKQFFKLLVLVIAIPLAGRSYWLVATVLSFLPGEKWENFIGFFITLGLISAILQLVSFLPRRIVQKIWRRGLVFRLLGGALGALNASIGLVVFALVTLAYPLFDWLVRWVAGSSVLMSLMELFGFVQTMLPQVFQDAATLVTAGTLG